MSCLIVAANRCWKLLYLDISVSQGVHQWDIMQTMEPSDDLAELQRELSKGEAKMPLIKSKCSLPFFHAYDKVYNAAILAEQW